MRALFASTFRSLRNYNYRVWSVGALVSNIGTWLQRTAQDWLVLTQLTDNNATAVGIVMALQFGPHLLMLPWSGFAADYFDRRKLLIVTQIVMAALAFGLGILTVTGTVRLWHVYIFAFLHGCASAFDTPARQIFVSDLVEDKDLANAVAINSTSFNAARMIGPAAAGALIAAVGTGWSFIANGVSFLAVLLSLLFLRSGELHRHPRAAWTRGSLAQGFHYVRKRPDLTAMMFMLFSIGTFGLNFPIFISTMAVTVFHTGAGQYGALSSALAIGTIGAALLATGREKPDMPLLLTSSALFGIGCAAAAVMPSYWLFGAALVVIGVATLTFTNGSNSLVQLTTERSMRGRVMAIRLAIALGATPIGAPIVGWVADRFGPRWALSVAAASGFAAALIALSYLRKHRNLKVRANGGRIRVSLDAAQAIEN